MHERVVQIYASCPQGWRLVKEFRRRLAGFGKQNRWLLKESQMMTITFPLYQLTASMRRKAHPGFWSRACMVSGLEMI